MAKITDPNIIAHSKELETLPFSKKDIEKFAFDVLADLGDEVINKAIEDGKIQIPGLQLLVRSESDIITDEDKQLLSTGKYILQVYMEGDDTPFTYYPFATGNQLVFIYFYVNDSQLIGYYFDIEGIVDLENKTYGYIYNEVEAELKIGQGGTKLYYHYLQMTGPSDEDFACYFISTSNSATTNFSQLANLINDAKTIVNYCKLVKGDEYIYVRGFSYITLGGDDDEFGIRDAVTDNGGLTLATKKFAQSGTSIDEHSVTEL